MQDYNTIIQMRQNQCSYNVVQARYRIDFSTVILMIKRFKECERPSLLIDLETGEIQD